MQIITNDNSKIFVEVVSDSMKQELIKGYAGQKDEKYRKCFTSRTYKLSNEQLLVEFMIDKQC